jgi:hypothetical protein
MHLNIFRDIIRSRCNSHTYLSHHTSLHSLPDVVHDQPPRHSVPQGGRHTLPFFYHERSALAQLAPMECCYLLLGWEMIETVSQRVVVSAHEAGHGLDLSRDYIDANELALGNTKALCWALAGDGDSAQENMTALSGASICKGDFARVRFQGESSTRSRRRTWNDETPDQTVCHNPRNHT